jgi:hypothetical protein
MHICFPRRLSCWILPVGLILASSPLLLSADDPASATPSGITLTPPPPPATAPATAPSLPTAPATLPPVTPPTAPASAENVLQQLLHDAPLPAGSAAAASGPASPSTAPADGAATQSARLREGDDLSGRVGRLVKDEKSGQWMFVFEADGKELQEPPIGLIPCRYLEVLEKLSANGTNSSKFKVSGKVTEYHGKYFLYLSYVQVVRDLNQF